MINNILEILKENIDKIGHYLVGLFLSIILNIVFNNILLTIVIILIISILKELYDLFFRKTGFNLIDLVFTVLGCYTIILYDFLK